MSKKPLRILCFGDSLTSGYWRFGAKSHPYAHRLEQRLKNEFPDRDVHVVMDGAEGDLASTGVFRRRMEMQWDQPGKYDWTIVLAGTNDLAYKFPVDTIYSSLSYTWEIPLSHGSKVLALTVPENSAKNRDLDEAREILNLSILGLERDDYFAFDLHHAIPHRSLSKEDRETYWDDAIHLTDRGYDWMGDHVADALIHIISNDGKTGSVIGWPDAAASEEATLEERQPGASVLTEAGGSSET